ncbi:MAG: hypothetical protein KBD01_18515 [Acidobacteria bacterium]|nr:hypothetical protein [Acidobacteriota bacterium]
MIRAAAALLCAALVAAAALAADATPAGLVQELLRMKAAGLGEGVIGDWLLAQPDRGAAPSADDLIALRQAGFSDEFLRILLGRAAAADGAAPAPAGPPGDAPQPVRFEVEYRARAGEDEAPWDLFLYLDGQVLAWAPAERNLLQRGGLRFSRALAPGRHVVRAAVERHRRSGPSGGWSHEARVAPVEIAFEVAAGAPLAVGIEYAESLLAPARAPLSWTVARGGDVLANRRNEGGPAAGWPELCEDIESGVGDGAPSRRARARLERCARWPALWTGATPVPDRATVLAQLAAYEFRPVPASAE